MIISESPSPKAKKRRSTSSNDAEAEAIFKEVLSPSSSSATSAANDTGASGAASGGEDGAAASASGASAAPVHGDPPDSEELIKALQDLETSASSDAVVREKIAKLPSSVSEVSQLETLSSPEEGKILMEKVRDHALESFRASLSKIFFVIGHSKNEKGFGFF